MLAAGCTLGHKPPPAAPHFVLGPAYQAGGVWVYPRESYDAVETGLAMVYDADPARLTADGEVCDATALAGAHPSLQLPAIVRLTNLETGRAVLVRLNDRGPSTPHRMVAVTRRTAALLGMPKNGVARVQLQVLPAESHAAADALPGAPLLAVATAPRDTVSATDLPPPPGARAAGGGRAAGFAAAAAAAGEDAPAAPPLHLPEQVWQTTPAPGTLWVRLGTFQGYQYAAMQRASVAGLGGRIEQSAEGRMALYRVMIGPLATVPQADAVLDQVIRAGISDARIVVE